MAGEGDRHAAPGTVLDLGCGTGTTDFNGRVVVGLDPVIEMLALSPVRDRVVGTGESLPLQEGSIDAVFSGFVFRNLARLTDTLAEIDRVLKPGVGGGGGRPGPAPERCTPSPAPDRHCLVAPSRRPLVAGAPGEYWYLHRSLDSLPPPETLFSGHALTAENIWRMGVFGFVYGGQARQAPR